MRSNHWPFVAIAALVVGVLAVLGWQRQTARDLRDEIARQRVQATELARRQAKERELATARAQAEEIDQMLAERATVAHLRKELDALRHRAEMLAEARPVVAEPEKAPPALTGNVLAFTLWRNLGRTTPEASLETALWASANGDIETFADLLIFDPDARNEATTLFTQLPEKLQQEFVSPERLVAVLAAKDVPLGSATILNRYSTPTETRLAVQIFDPEGKHKMALLSLRPDDAGWRFVVPINAVKRYAAWLHAPPGAVGPGQP